MRETYQSKTDDTAGDEKHRGRLRGDRRAVVAALLIGVSDGIISVFFSPTLAKIIATAAVALVLVFRPTGLFGTAAR